MGRVVLGFLKLRGIEFDALSVLVKKRVKDNLVSTHFLF